MMNTPKAGGPDPVVEEAIRRLAQAELSPLEEQLFTGWLAANGMEEGGLESDTPIDLKQVYKDTEGKVMPTGQLQREIEKASAIQTIMQAQEAHDAASPIKALMDARGGGGGQALPMGGAEGPPPMEAPQGPPMGGGGPIASMMGGRMEGM